MTAQYLQLKQAAFGFPTGTTFTLDDQDARYLDIVNSGMVTVVANPGGAVPTLPSVNPGGTSQASESEVAVMSGAAPGLVGKWYAPGQGVVGNIPNEAVELTTPIVFARDCKIDRLAVEVTTVGAAPAVVRLGIRADDRGMPGPLLLDAGTVSGSATAGALETGTFANPIAVLAGQRLWLSAVVQGASATRPTMRSLTHGIEGIVGGDGPAGALANSLGGYASPATITGALPPAPPAWSQSANPTRVAARTAAA